jgi:hypothetical protein
MTEHAPSNDWLGKLKARFATATIVWTRAHTESLFKEIARLQRELEALKEHITNVDDARTSGEPPAALPEPPDGRADTAHRCVTLADKLLAERGYMPESSVRHQLRIALSCITDLQRAMQPPGACRFVSPGVFHCAKGDIHEHTADGVCGVKPALTKAPECQHDQTKPNPTVVPLGSAAFGSSDWTWMCTVCNDRFNLPVPSAQGERDE